MSKHRRKYAMSKTLIGTFWCCLSLCHGFANVFTLWNCQLDVSDGIWKPVYRTGCLSLQDEVKILRRIGEGAFGEVSLATCAIFGSVAVKWLKVIPVEEVKQRGPEPVHRSHTH